MVSGENIIRPRGQVKAPTATVPSFTAVKRLDYELEIGMFVGGKQDPFNAWKTLAAFIGHHGLHGYGPLVFASHDTPDTALGVAGPWFPALWPEPELAWSLWSLADEGKGYALEAVQAIRAHLWASGWTTAVSYVAAANSRSIALAERLGCAVESVDPQDGELTYRHPAQVAA